MSTLINLTGKTSVLLLALTLATMRSGAQDGMAKRPAEFVSEAHTILYNNYEAAVKSSDTLAEIDRKNFSSALSGQIEARLAEVAPKVAPTRVRELRKITSGWFDDAGQPKEIGKDVPDEMAPIVSAYRSALRQTEEKQTSDRRRNYEFLLRGIDSLAIELDRSGEAEKTAILRAEAQALLEANTSGVQKYGKLEASYVPWFHGDQRYVRLLAHGDELPSLAYIRGTFAGGGESAYVGPFDEANWGEHTGLLAHSMQKNVEAGAYALRDPRLNLADAKMIFRGVEPGHRREKLIHSSRGFCYLAGVWGNQGDLTTCDVKIDPDDGFYYLTGRMQSFSRALAIGVEYPEGKMPQFELSTVAWQRGDPGRELIAAEDGICLLNGLTGAFHSHHDSISLRIGNDGHWRLYGTSQSINTGARALVIKFKPEPESE